MNRPWLCIGLLACCLGCGSAPPTPAASAQPDVGAHCDYYDYRFEVDAALQHMTATVCFDGRPPLALVCGPQGDRASVPSAERISGEQVTRLPTRGCHIDLRGLSTGDCVRYTIDLRATARQMTMGFGAANRGVVMTQTGNFLYRPVSREASLHGHATLSMPDGMNASVPWLRDADGYLLNASAFEQMGYGVFGAFETERVEALGATLDVAIIDRLAAHTRTAVAPWLRRVVETTSQLGGEFPAERAQVVLVPQPGAGGVRFGMIGRGGGPSVMYVLGRESTETELVESWEPAHELTHLRTPLTAEAERWLTEGIATYYQEVLRARAGIATSEQAWKRLHRGLMRGATVGTGRTLRQEAADMYVTGAFQRVYWVGVALALMADVELRRGSDNAISLDHVVLGLQACCAQQSRTWSSTEMLAQMDTLAGRPVFTELAQRHLDQADFPDVAATFAALGISIGADDAVLDPASTLAGVRTGIMAPVATKALAAEPANTTCVNESLECGVSD